jgi:hypothetical protein
LYRFRRIVVVAVSSSSYRHFCLSLSSSSSSSYRWCCCIVVITVLFLSYWHRRYIFVIVVSSSLLYCVVISLSSLYQSRRRCIGTKLHIISELLGIEWAWRLTRSFPDPSASSASLIPSISGVWRTTIQPPWRRRASIGDGSVCLYGT